MNAEVHSIEALENAEREQPFRFDHDELRRFVEAVFGTLKEAQAVVAMEKPGFSAGWLEDACRPRNQFSCPERKSIDVLLPWLKGKGQSALKRCKHELEAARGESLALLKRRMQHVQAGKHADLKNEDENRRRKQRQIELLTSREQCLKGLDSTSIEQLLGRLCHRAPTLWLGRPAGAFAFTGRAALLDRIKNALNEHRVVTLRGPRGVGKSALAIGFGEECQSRLLYSVIIHTDATTRTSVAKCFQNSLRKLGRETPNSSDVTALKDCLRKELAKGERKPWLQIIDDCPSDMWDAALIVEPAAIPERCNVLVLSSARRRASEDSEIEVPELEANEAAEFLMRLAAGTPFRKLPKADRELAHRICALAWNFPLRLLTLRG